MRELLRTNDVVLLGAIEAFLASAEIDYLLADVHISAVEGSIGILPRRILVLDEDLVEARRLLIGAGLGEGLPPMPEGGGFWSGQP